MKMDNFRTIRLNLALPLRFLGREEKAITDKINSLISQYLSEIDGYLIKWRNLNILDDKGTIIDDQPYVFWRISFEGHVFKPEDGKILIGKVKKITKSYLIVRALDAFSITITIPEEFNDKPAIKTIMLESELYFKMKSLTIGMIDEECIELSESILTKELDDVYAYADNFEY